MTICIQYSRPESGSSESEIFGYDVAVTNFLSAYFRNTSAPQFICRPTDEASFDHFKALAAAQGIDAEARCVGLDPRHPDKNLQSISCIFRPDPLIADVIWRRPQVHGRGFATCGLVHTMSGTRITMAVADLCTAPSDSTDALICPSRSIRDAVNNLWGIHADYFNHRFGGNFKCPVETPVIPLGIDTEKFVARTTPDKRKAQREALAVAEDEIIILFVGRLSFATKAHPLPMMAAAEEAAKRTGKKVRLVMFGYFKPEGMEPYFRKLAADTCHTARAEFVMNNDARFPDGLWAAADIFVSLSENIQESFGLTPIEAMACGLPAVVTDWDGYREGVRHGEEGYLVPVIMPPPATGMDIARHYYNQDNYGLYLTASSQSTAVDSEWCAKCFVSLISDPALRKTMGEKGRKRAREVFDWKVVIKAYDALWQSLAEKRQTSVPAQALPVDWQAAHPAYPNPWEMFRSFPTRSMTTSDILQQAADDSAVAAALANDMNYFVPDLLLSKQQLRELVEVIRKAGAVQIGDLLAAFPQDAHPLFVAVHRLDS